MRVRAQSSTGDYTFGSGGQNFLVNSPSMVAQLVYTALMLFLGEWFLDTSAGTPWMTDVIGVGTAATYDTAIRNQILGVPGVKSIITYNSSLEGTTLTISGVVVDTPYGAATVPLVGITVPPNSGWGTAPGYGQNGFGA
jgi:hypothetical protein